MKIAFPLLLLVLFILSTSTVDAQKRKARVVKGPKGKTAVVHKTKKGVVARKVNRKRVKRTRVVHHHYKHLPRRGAVVKSIHAKALSINFRGTGFRYHAGVWYKPIRNEWKVIRPTKGIRVRTLPAKHRRMVIGTRTYFYYYGTYYIQQNDEYEVVDAPLGAEVDSLPEGYTTKTITGEDYYELDDTYYMPSVNEEGEEILVAVPNPEQ